MLANLAFVFSCVRASSALVGTSAFLQPVVRGQVYIFEILPPLYHSRKRKVNISVEFVVFYYVHARITGKRQTQKKQKHVYLTVNIINTIIMLHATGTHHYFHSIYVLFQYC